jgi:hypothetical protein
MERGLFDYSDEFCHPHCQINGEKDIKLGERDETIGMRNASNREKNRL